MFDSLLIFWNIGWEKDSVRNLWAKRIANRNCSMPPESTGGADAAACGEKGTSSFSEAASQPPARDDKNGEQGEWFAK